MKIEVKTSFGKEYYGYKMIKEWKYKQKQFDYIFKYLDFNKLCMDFSIWFDDENVKYWFKQTYEAHHLISLINIYKYSPKGYEYLKNNWSKGVFILGIMYSDKQILKTIVNKVINIELIMEET